MIGIAFFRGGEEVVEVRIDGNNLQWRSSIYGSQFFPIETIDMPKERVLAEFPDLEDCKDWRDKAIERFKKHFSFIDGENNKARYVIEELRKVGYQVHSYQRQGERVKKWTGSFV